jgi:hypothetical protein
VGSRSGRIVAVDRIGAADLYGDVMGKIAQGMDGKKKLRLSWMAGTSRP